MRSSSISDVFVSKYEPAIKARVITTRHRLFQTSAKYKTFDTQEFYILGLAHKEHFSLFL